MKEKTREAVAQTVNQACAKIHQIVPQAVELAGESFTGEVSVKIRMNCGGIPTKPVITFEF